MLVEIPREKWRPVNLGAGRMSAAIDCPSCGQHGVLEDHEIRADGRVEPSVVCPNELAGCSFHAFVRLLGWSF